MNTTRQPLTHIQGQVLAYMAKFLQLNDQLPPQLTIAAAFGWASTNAALDHLKALEKKGYLARNEIGHFMLADRPAPHVVYLDNDAISPETLDQLRDHIKASRQPLLVVRQPEKAAALVMLDALRAVASKLGSRPYGTGSYLPKPIRDQVLNAIQAATVQTLDQAPAAVKPNPEAKTAPAVLRDRIAQNLAAMDTTVASLIGCVADDDAEYSLELCSDLMSQTRGLTGMLEAAVERGIIVSKEVAHG